jgi:predicted  nucleic acid-binding Zn-ribbon protein
MTATAFNIFIAIISVTVAAAAFYGANRATRTQAAAASHAVDAAAYTRATDIYESTIAALRAEITRLSTEISEAREDIRAARTDMAALQQSNRELTAELTQYRSR